MNQKECFLAWQLTLPGEAKRFWHLVECFGSVENAWNSSEKQLVSVGGFTPEGAREMVLRRRGIHPEAEMSLLESKGISFVHYHDPEYPEILRNIFDPPPGFFLRGRINPDDSQAVALVGARKASRYGVTVASKLAGELAKAGVTVVSGLARGIDTAAHRGALAAGGRTIAVLGCGLDIAYPKENADLMEDISRSGAVISEFPLRMWPDAWHFPVRNRIISGLSQGVVVVEAAVRSGALITADFALDQGREVMAVPGNITSDLSRGPNRLIRQGARPVESAGDVLEDLGLEGLFKVDAAEAKPRISLSADEETVRKNLLTEPLALDDLIERTGLPTQKVLVSLTYLEMKGIVRQFPGKLYALSNHHV